MIHLTGTEILALGGIAVVATAALYTLLAVTGRLRRYEGRHLTAGAPEAVRAPAVGSMILAEEWAYKREVMVAGRGGWISGPCLDEPDWDAALAHAVSPGPLPELVELDRPEGITPAGFLRGLDQVLAGTTTNLNRDPDDPYDPADDEPFTMIEQERLATTLDRLTSAVTPQDWADVAERRPTAWASLLAASIEGWGLELRGVR